MTQTTANGPQALAGTLRDALARGRNADGGWGYFPGKTSRLEPSCWATLALARPGRGPAPAPETAPLFRLMAAWRQASGLLAEGGAPPNLAYNGLAALAAGACAGHADERGQVARLRTSIARVRGVRLWPAIYQRQNNRLRGWPWIEETFSWTEPTAWCLLALKRWRAELTDAERARIGEAEAVLVDRSCSAGGWNVGNSNVLGRQLVPHVPTTAAALLALQDRLELPAFRRGLDYLQGAWSRERSGLGLALSALALSAVRLPADAMAPALEEAERRTGFLGNFCVMGMAAVALDTIDGARNPFAL